MDEELKKPQSLETVERIFPGIYTWYAEPRTTSTNKKETLHVQTPMQFFPGEGQLWYNPHSERGIYLQALAY